MSCNFFRSVLGLLIWIVPLTFASGAPTPNSAQTLDDPLEIISQRRPRSDQDDDRLAAAAHFAAGRMLEQRRMLPEALRHYERAIRYDSDASPVLRELLPLAFAIDRPEEGLRYAIKYAEQNPVDDVILAHAAEYLAETGQWKQAIALYKRLAESLAKERAGPQQVAVDLQLGRLYYLNQQFAESASMFEKAVDALNRPKASGLEPKSVRAIIGADGAIYELAGAAFLQAGKPDQARDAFDRFNSFKPDAAQYALNLARVELAADKPQTALDELHKYLAAEKTAKSARPYDLLSQALKKLNQSDELISRLASLRRQAGRRLVDVLSC